MPARPLITAPSVDIPFSVFMFPAKITFSQLLKQANLCRSFLAVANCCPSVPSNMHKTQMYLWCRLVHAAPCAQLDECVREGACVRLCLWACVSVFLGPAATRQTDCRCMPWHTSTEGGLTVWFWQDKQSIVICYHTSCIILINLRL